MGNSAQIARERLLTAVTVDRVSRVNAIEYTDVPSSDAVRMGQIFGAYPTAAGTAVTEVTAMRVAAVYRAAALIAGAIASLPLAIYRRGPDNTREPANDHPLWWLLNEQPTPRFVAPAFWEFIVAQVLFRGDGIAYIVRRNSYSPEPIGFIPVKRENVQIMRRDDRLMYRIMELDTNGSPQYFVADQDDVLHFPGFGFDGIQSKSVIQWAAREAIGIALAADQHAGQFFGSGAHLQYAVKSPGKMTQDQQESFRQAWVAKYSGQGYSKIPLMLTEGLDVTELSMTAADAQLLESRKFQVIDIARAFGVPPHMLGETTASTSWGSGIESMGIGFVTYTLRPHLRRFSVELNRKLFPRYDRYLIEYKTESLMQGDSKAQAEYFGKALGGPGAQGWMVVNEVRRIMNLPPVDGGDKLVVLTGAKPADPNADPNKPKPDPGKEEGDGEEGDGPDGDNPDDPGKKKEQGE